MTEVISMRIKVIVSVSPQHIQDITVQDITVQDITVQDITVDVD